MFCDEGVEESRDRSGGFAVLQFILMLGIITVLFAAFSIVGFQIQKNKLANAGKYFETLLEEQGLQLSISDRNLLINGEAAYEKVVNTFENEVGEIKVIIDNRDSATTYDDFKAMCNKSDDVGNPDTMISYEEYLQLDEEAKKDYVFGIEYTGKTLEFTDEKILTYETYLSSISDKEHPAYDAEMVKTYKELRSKKEKMDIKEYATELYQLYFLNYYPQITDVEQYGVAPTVRTYYDTLYKRQNEDGERIYKQYIILTQKYVYLSLDNDLGNNFTFSGNYRALEGELDNKEALQEIFECAYHSQIKAVFLLFMLNAARMMVLIFTVLIAFALLWMIVSRLNKKEMGRYLSENMKMVCTNLTTATLLVCPIHFLLSLFCSRTDAFWYSILLILLVVIIRMILFIFRTYQEPKEEVES